MKVLTEAKHCTKTNNIIVHVRIYLQHYNHPNAIQWNALT